MSDDRPLGQLGSGTPQRRAALPRHTHSSDSTGGPLIGAILTDVEIDTDNFVTLVDTAFTLQSAAQPTQAAQFRVSGSGSVAYIFTLPASDGTVVLLDLAQVLTNKTLGATNTVTLLDTLFTLQDNGNTGRQMQFQLSGITAGNLRVLTVPDSDGTLVLLTLAQTLQNKTIDATNSVQPNDSGFLISSASDSTRQAVFSAASISHNAQRTFTFPNADGTLVLVAHTQTLTNKKIGDPSDPTKAWAWTLSGATTGKTITHVSAHTADRTVTWPDATGQVVLRDTTDTLTNKKLSNANVSFVDGVDPTKTITFSHAGTGGVNLALQAIPSVNRSLTFPDATDTLVGKATTDTLTNKTLTTPTIADFSNANHNHINSANGNTVDHTSLTQKGTNTHAQLDTHLAAGANVHGLGASINVLGDRNGASEYIQRGLATTTSGELTSGSVFYATVAVSFPGAFSALQAITATAVTTNHGVSAKVHSQSTSGFTLELWSMQTGLVNGQSAYWCAVGS